MSNEIVVTRIGRATVCNLFKIKAPRWKDRTVLLADWKVGTHNEIRIEAARKDGVKFFPEPLYISGEDVRKHKKQAHSVRSVYVVPLDAFNILERV